MEKIWHVNQYNFLQTGLLLIVDLLYFIIPDIITIAPLPFNHRVRMLSLFNANTIFSVMFSPFPELEENMKRNILAP